jgi:hypothetical protein
VTEFNLNLSSPNISFQLGHQQIQLDIRLLKDSNGFMGTLKNTNASDP